MVGHVAAASNRRIKRFVFVTSATGRIVCVRVITTGPVGVVRVTCILVVMIKIGVIWVVTRAPIPRSSIRVVRVIRVIRVSNAVILKPVVRVVRVGFIRVINIII